MTTANRLGHPLAQYIFSIAAALKLNGAEIVFDYTAWPQTAVALKSLVGKSGTLSRTKYRYAGPTVRSTLFLRP